VSVFDDASVLITGGTGSFGKRFARTLLDTTKVARVVVFSRDELKQYEMQQLFPAEPRLRYFIGDVRDYRRLHRALRGVQVVVHAAALKQVPAAEYNPFEAVKTNILGAQNVIEAAIEQGVSRVMALSTDKACSPVNLYGATKLVSDKLFISGNAYAGGTPTRFAVVRYGNVAGSRGSVIPFFRQLAPTGRLPITDERMTRFWITLDQGVSFVMDRLEHMHGGELYVPKIPSVKVIDLAKAIAPDAALEIVGIRPSEKIHEEMINVSDARSTVDMGAYYVIQPELDWWPTEHLVGESVPRDFAYASNTNTQWLSYEDLATLVAHV
jgi:UDP-N-acetylglucosamine 4,6-dehydratase/5-epimerase